MNQKIMFYPLGNAETVLLELSNDKRMLMDFADMHTSDSRYTNLTNTLGSHEMFDVVMFSHAHEDHVKGASDFFYFDYTPKYQGGTRAKIKDLWISSAFFLDSNICEDARVIRQEARHRLKSGYGIKVFAEPDSLVQWLKDNEMSIDDVADCIIHAGTIIDNTMHDLGDEVEFFVHAPFSEDSEDVVDRNDPSIIIQVRLKNALRHTNIFITGDTPHEVLDKVVQRSEANHNSDYLKWDIYDIPHHCSKTGVFDEQGETSENVERLLSEYKQQNAIMVASCRPFDEAPDSPPPSIEAKDEYIKYCGKTKFYATSEYPNATSPKPLCFIIDDNGVREDAPRRVSITTSPAPRAG